MNVIIFAQTPGIDVAAFGIFSQRSGLGIEPIRNCQMMIMNEIVNETNLNSAESSPHIDLSRLMRTIHWPFLTLNHLSHTEGEYNFKRWHHKKWIKTNQISLQTTPFLSVNGLLRGMKLSLLEEQELAGKDAKFRVRQRPGKAIHSSRPSLDY